MVLRTFFRFRFAAVNCMEKSEPMVFKKSDPFVLSIIVFIAFYLRSIYLDTAALWIDEAFRYSHSSQSLGGMFLRYAADSHPPLYGLALHFWMSQGDSLFWLRFLSVVFSSLSLIVLWLLFRNFLSSRQAVYAVFLTAISPFHIALAQEMNYPSMMFLLSAVALLGAVYFAGRPAVGYLALYVVFSLAALLTHYNGVFLVFSINVAIVVYFLAGRAWRPLWMWLGGQVVFAAAGLTLSSSLPSQAQRLLGLLPAEQVIGHLRSLPVGGIPRVYKALLLGEHFGTGGAVNLAVLAAMVLLAVAGIVLAWRAMERGEKIIIFVIVFLTPAVGFAMMLTTGLYFFPKYYFYLQPLLLILLLRGWGGIGSAPVRWLGFAAVALLFSVSLAQYYGGLKVSEDNRTVIGYIEDNSSGDDLLLVNPPYLSLVFDFYSPDILFPQGVPENYDSKRPYTEIRRVTGEDLGTLGRYAKRFDRVWVFYGLGTITSVDPEGRMAQLLLDNCELEDSRTFHVAPFQPRAGVLYVFKNCQ